MAAVDENLTSLTPPEGRSWQLPMDRPETWANTILYQLATELKYPTLNAGDDKDTRKVIVADPPTSWSGRRQGNADRVRAGHARGREQRLPQR